MSACVETMMYVREKPWHGLGVRVEEAPCSLDAIKLAGLDWEVNSNPVCLSNGSVIENYKANVRSSDGSVLGIVTDRYKIVQNSEAFEFTDELIGEGAVYETAGSLRGGKCVWLLAKLPDQKILGDSVEPYLCFTNTHDGSGAIRVFCTPIRVVCQNTLNLALSDASRSWSTKHVGDIRYKLEEARQTLGMATKYMEELNSQATTLADKKICDADIEHIFDTIYPIDYNKDTERKIRNIEQLKDNLFTCYSMSDIAQFKNTAWGLVNAAADFVDHTAPIRMTQNYQENNWNKIMIGHPFLDAIYSSVR